MSELLQHLKTAFRDNFGSAMFLLVAGTIALLFIGYLLLDYFRAVLMTLRIKRRHRQESHHREHRHS